jgi:hypothetical protein
MELYCTPKVNTLQLNTVGNSPNTRTRTTHTVSEHSILYNSSNRTSCGSLKTLPFLKSQSFQTHVGTIHRRAIGPLAHHNGTSAHSPSLTCHLPAPTIGCLHSNDSLTTLTSSFQVPYLWKFTNIQPITIDTPVHCCELYNAACLFC